jgi:hypothetical protein
MMSMTMNHKFMRRPEISRKTSSFINYSRLKMGGRKSLRSALLKGVGKLNSSNMVSRRKDLKQPFYGLKLKGADSDKKKTGKERKKKSGNKSGNFKKMKKYAAITKKLNYTGNSFHSKKKKHKRSTSFDVASLVKTSLIPRKGTSSCGRAPATRRRRN